MYFGGAGGGNSFYAVGSGKVTVQKKPVLYLKLPTHSGDKEKLQDPRRCYSDLFLPFKSSSLIGNVY